MPYIEIENKYRITETQLEALLEFVKREGLSLAVEKHEDRYLSPAQDDFLSQRFPFKWLSIRTRDSKAILNYKHFFPEGAEQHSHADEYESEIGNPKEVEAIFRELGIFTRVSVKKERRQVEFEQYLICLDDVEGLGLFLEIECTADASKAVAKKAEIHQFAKQFGVTPDQQDFRGYPFLLLDTPPSSQENSD